MGYKAARLFLLRGEPNVLNELYLALETCRIGAKERKSAKSSWIAWII